MKGGFEKVIKIKQAVIVEGKYDKIKLSSILDALIIETDGFALFRDKEKQQLIRRLADTRGIVILTDSDSAGFLIRSFLCGSVANDRIVNVYIPDIFGKEKRKTEPSKEGKLGVEGVSSEVIIAALNKAGVICNEITGEPNTRKITNIDLFEDGMSGTQDSRRKRIKLLLYFDLPTRMSTNSLVDILNCFVSYEEYKQAVKAISKEETQCSE